jgi:hypothetical protein
MRSTGWILAAIILGCAGWANGDQFGCAGCGGQPAGWQAYQAALSGEACASPPGFSLGAGGTPCCWTNQSPCCDNAWDGYCEHRARVQAYWYQVGTPRPGCYPVLRSMPRVVQTRVYYGCPPATVQRLPAPTPVTASPNVPSTPSLSPVPDSPKLQPTPSTTPALPSVQPTPEPPVSPTPKSPNVQPTPTPPASPAPKSPNVQPTPTPSVSSAPESLSEAPMPPGEAFRGIGQLWLR